MAEQESSFISQLFAKLADVIKIQEETGKSTGAAQKETRRQISQASKGGNPVKGEGVTKSGQED